MAAHPFLLPTSTFASPKVNNVTFVQFWHCVCNMFRLHCLNWNNFRILAECHMVQENIQLKIFFPNLLWTSKATVSNLSDRNVSLWRRSHLYTMWCCHPLQTSRSDHHRIFSWPSSVVKARLLPIHFRKTLCWDGQECPEAPDGASAIKLISSLKNFFFFFFTWNLMAPAARWFLVANSTLTKFL